MKRRWWFIGVATVVAVVTVQTVSFGAKATTPSDNNEELYKALELFESALSLIRSDYVEEPQPKALVYGRSKGCSRRSIRTASSLTLTATMN